MAEIFVFDFGVIPSILKFCRSENNSVQWILSTDLPKRKLSSHKNV